MNFDKFSDIPPQLIGYDAAQHVHLTNEQTARTTRSAIIDYLWSDSCLPIHKRPAARTLYTGTGSLPRDVADLDSERIAKIDQLVATVDFEYTHIAYCIYPQNALDVPRLAIVHQGHQGGLKDGIGDVASMLLHAGFIVILMQMPLVGWNHCRTFQTADGNHVLNTRGSAGHNALFDLFNEQSGSVMSIFVEPVIQNINFFITHNPDYQDITMIGLSGGGWTTHIAAAVDERITMSIPTAGSYPLYLREVLGGGTKGDAEQYVADLYEERASWLDIYILGAYGDNRRKQIQLLNQYDSCCFFGPGYKTYENVVSDAVEDLGKGEWRVVSDATHHKHQISPWAIEHVIKRELELELGEIEKETPGN